MQPKPVPSPEDAEDSDKRKGVVKRCMKFFAHTKHF
nr:MAG TPA: hypothetical protein [Caudoviricetes sp.]